MLHIAMKNFYAFGRFYGSSTHYRPYSADDIFRDVNYNVYGKYQSYETQDGMNVNCCFPFYNMSISFLSCPQAGYARHTGIAVTLFKPP